MKVREASRLARRLAVNNTMSPDLAIASAVDFVVEQNATTAKQEKDLKTKITNQLLGFGQLQELIIDESVEEIWVNAPNQVYVARGGKSAITSLVLEPGEIQLIVERMLRSSGRRLDRSSPFVDASLEDGSRLHVVIPEITRKEWSVNIRKFPRSLLTLRTLQALGTVTSGQRDFLQEVMAQKKNVLVSGATQAGKTTILSALLNESEDSQRIVSVEETFEIQVSKPDWVGLQTRQPNLEGVGEVSLRKLIKEALRMRPDRLVVGEVREAEALDLLIALNSGLPGICTIHANSARDAISKLCTLPLLAGQNISTDFVVPTVGRCIDLVVHCQLNENGFRQVQEIISVDWDSSSKQLLFSEVNVNDLV
ncbi:unannotated protein [freshwater metagenome]|uniref:Unannotated protein n=1 Tax=freshwater metagenome TaxID=449393 RepID=A0A6J6IC05_9ZZZZ